jgi:hypothetical protein
MEESEVYYSGFAITAIITFIASWIYCIVSYGYLLGVGLGWLPSLIVAFISGLIWPLVAFALIIWVLVVAFFLYKGM